MTRIINSKKNNRFRWKVFYDSAIKITHLHDELLDYYRVFFWYMSFFFGNIIVIFCNFIHVIFIGRTVPLILRLLIGWVTIVHMAIIECIIYFSDDILKQNKKIVTFLSHSLRNLSLRRLRIWQRLKIHHFYYELSRSKIAFRVINGYVLRRATILVVNIFLSIFLFLSLCF